MHRKTGNEKDNFSNDAPNDDNEAKSVVQLDPILEAEAKYGPIFRRELFDATYAAHQLILQATPEELRGKHNNKIALRNIYGGEENVDVMDERLESPEKKRPWMWKRAWSYRSLQALGDYYGHGGREHLFPYSIGLRGADLNPVNCFEPNINEKAKLWTQEWKESEMCSRVTDFLEQHAGKSMPRVDQIICFGLGCISAQERSGRNSFIQHIAAVLIRDIITRLQHDTKPLPILAQDPQYCNEAKCYLAKHHDISIIDDPEGFKLVDGNTFVLSFAPNVPVRQIVQGLTHEFGGPTGIFCDRITNDGLDCNGKSNSVENGISFTPYNTCPSSPALWKYKQGGVNIEFERCDWFPDTGVYLRKKKG